ncbi:MAG TPA: UdgX family uracil-DNA binding protein [Tahibacter sp.]|uniref:UdgX family uracil-DNA binding protein n=1 Tax=Tahibacter sp. TaxID=2056211 RepID=UPI002B6AC196|nr:UdgX family uracil-DNA binding protein [Tahibacter sp.]HSX62177.1 UdgX family uracil-DNA binding protein [Tahibacter sp.]
MAWRGKDEDATTPARPAISARSSLARLRAAAKRCRACPLWEPATQTVFGEGPERARDFLIGEQPGDREDLAGRPFVGPAGQLLDRALAEAGIDRDTLYLTNAVKHFKYRLRGKRRLHARASAAEQAACRFWLDAELARVQPARIVCLGAMAAQALFGRGFRLLRERGVWRELDSGARAFATVHPAFLLRLRDADEREAAYRQFVADLRLLVEDA